MTPPVLLTVAGTDSGGAAGIAADLATFAAHATHGACVVTAVTAQDTTGVRAVHVPPPAIIDAQISAVLDDLPVSAVKTGMLGCPETVRLIADRLGHLPLVVDPVLLATSGAVLGNEAVRAAYVEHLLPRATVITPNLDEARSLLGVEGEPRELAAKLAGLGPAVVVTGGPDGGIEGGFETGASAPSSTNGGGASAPSSTTTTCTDWVAVPGQDPIPLTHPAVPTSNDHGTGCTFSAALAAQIALMASAGEGTSLTTAVCRAAAYTSGQLAISRSWQLGRGRGPIAHTIPIHHDPSR